MAVDSIFSCREIPFGNSSFSKPGYIGESLSMTEIFTPMTSPFSLTNEAFIISSLLLSSLHRIVL